MTPRSEIPFTSHLLKEKSRTALGIKPGTSQVRSTFCIDRATKDLLLVEQTIWMFIWWWVCNIFQFFINKLEISPGIFQQTFYLCILYVTNNIMAYMHNLLYLYQECTFWCCFYMHEKKSFNLGFTRQTFWFKLFA